MKSTAAEITDRQGLTSNGAAPQTGERARVGDADSLLWRIVRPVGMAALFLTLWGLAVRWSGSDLFPTPGNVARGIIELIKKDCSLNTLSRPCYAFRGGLRSPWCWAFRWDSFSAGTPAPFRLSTLSSKFCAQSHRSPGFQWRSSGSA